MEHDELQVGASNGEAGKGNTVVGEQQVKGKGKGKARAEEGEEEFNWD
jgi:hypothetical protein